MNSTTTSTDWTDLDVAIAHKDYAVAGGGEIVAERLGLALDSPVYTGFLNTENRPQHLRADVRDLFSGGLSGWMVRRGGITRQLAYRYLYRRTTQLHDYDVVIQSGMEPLWYQPRDIQTTIAYVHSTPRMQYDLYPYLNEVPENRRSWLGTLVQETYDDRVRKDFQAVQQYPDYWIANSDLVAHRLETYWNIPSEDIRVVYPPVPTDQLGPENATDQRDVYLSVNRLDDWKRIDEIVDAFRELDATLLVAGKGPAEDDLRERASDCENIRFLGFVDEREKHRLLAEARALVYNPLNEDFGMVPIEALASGTPVISVRDGFQRYQLEDGITGVLFERDLHDRDATVRNLRRAVKRFEADGVTANTDGLQAVASQFSVERFNRDIRTVVESAVERAAIEPRLDSMPPKTRDPPIDDADAIPARTDGRGGDQS